MKTLILLFAILLISCTKQEKRTECPIITFDISQKVTLSHKDIECKFIALETNDKCLLRAIVDIHFYDNKIFIIDGIKNSKVFIFDNQGKFISQIGDIGSGPGEYAQPYRMHIDKKDNQIIIADTRLNKLIHYRLDNFKYISDQKAFNFSDCAWLPDGNILWFNTIGFDTGKRKNYFIQITDKELNTITYHGKTQELPPYCIGEQTLFQFNEESYIAYPFTSVVYQVTSNDIQERFKLSFGVQEMPSSEYFINLFKENGASGPDIMLRSDYINSFNVFETNNYIATSYFSKNFESYLGFYNKQTKETNALSCKDFSRLFQLPNVSFIRKAIDNYFIMQLNAKEIVNKQSSYKELNDISKKLTEESNPILCLFKFN